MTDDSDIWQRIRDRDEKAFESLYRANGGRLCAYLRQIVPGAQLAEDLMQETFTSVWQSPNGFHPERGSLRSYLFGMARRRAADWWRSHSHDRKGFQSAQDGQEDTAGSAASFSDVADSFSRLPEEQQSILWLREIEGQSYAELAQILAIPAGTVKSRLFAAREELRRIWHSSKTSKESRE